jgi:hypothetical protein
MALFLVWVTVALIATPARWKPRSRIPAGASLDVHESVFKKAA